MKDNFNDLQIADQKLDCSFIKLMPDYLKEEVIEVLNKYKSYCDKDAKIVDNESKIYKKDENGAVMIFDVSTFMNVWDSYSYSIWTFKRSLWTKPTEFFKKMEHEFLSKQNTLIFESVSPASLKKELQNRIEQYSKDDIMACEKVLNDKKEEKN